MMTKEPDRFDQSVTEAMQGLRLLIAKGNPELREKRQIVLDKFLEADDEVEAEKIKQIKEEQTYETRLRMSIIQDKYEAAIKEIHDYIKQARYELATLDPDTPPNISSFSEGKAMTKEFQTVDGKKVSFTPKSLGVRNMRSLLECIEGLKTVEHKSEVFVLIEKGLGLCIDNYDAEAIDVDMQTAMGIMADTLSFNVVKADERKKSE
jgi:hypothetical protein